MKEKKVYLYGLEHIRGLSCVFILLFHSTTFITLSMSGIKDLTFFNGDLLRTRNIFFSLILEGQTFVSVFLIISGFLLTITTYNKEINYFNFVKKRILRIYPLFLFMILIGTYAFPDRFDFLRFISNITIFGNIYPMNLSPFNDANWTISVLIIFYLIFPFLKKILKNKLDYIKIILFFIIIRLFVFLITGTIQNIAAGTILGRIDQFLIGMFFADIYINKSNNLKNLKVILYFIISIFSVFTMTYFYNQIGGNTVEKWWKIFWLDIEGIVWSFFIIFYLQIFNKKVKLVYYLNNLSYSVYLLHSTVLYIILKYRIFIFFKNIKYGAFMTGLLIVFPLTLILSLFTYSYIEKPFLQKKEQVKN